jgi:branched-chain amino acid transport system ATP-binding protein
MPGNGEAPRPSVRVLRTVDLSASYSGVKALSDVNLEVQPGRVVGLIGPNGAGKTTCIDAISGFIPTTGVVELGGARIDGLSVHKRSRSGLARSFQNLELYGDLTVRENLLVAYEGCSRGNLLLDVIAPRIRRDSPDVDAALELFGLTSNAESGPASLSLGQQKLVSVARALAGDPSVVLLDEPAAGLNSSESAELGRRLRSLADRGLGVLLVDHDMSLVLGVCDSIYVMNVGSVIAQGTPQEVRRDPAVRDAYLGGAAAEIPAKHHVSVSRVVRAEVGEDEATRSNGQNLSSTSKLLPSEAGVPLLELEGVTAGYGEITVLQNLSLNVRSGELVALLGANGAGKTTTLLAASGAIRTTRGTVRFAGEPVQGGRPWRTAQAGLAHILSGHPVFADLTVRENLRLGLQKGRLDMDQVLNYFPALHGLLDRRAGLLSGGEQQMLMLARGLLGRPSMLLVDEMSLGLAPIVVEQLAPVLRQAIDDTGAGVLMVEQHVGVALEIADRAYVMRRGEIVLEGSTDEIAGQAELLEVSYLGDQS